MFKPSPAALPQDPAQSTDQAGGPANARGRARGIALLVSAMTLCTAGALGTVILSDKLDQPDLRGPIAEFASMPIGPLPSATDIAPTDLRELTPTLTTTTTTTRLRRNSTLIQAVGALGVDTADTFRALQAIYDRDYLDPRKLAAGLEVDVTQDDQGKLVALSITPERGRTILSKRGEGTAFLATEMKARLFPSLRRVAAEIDTSFYQAVLAEGAGDQQVADFAQIFAFDVDFQREIHPGDSFELLYETYADERGNLVSQGDLVYAALNGRAVSKSYYRHRPSDDGVVDYFDSDGESATRFLMKTPINGARLSSGFGRRRHPISGYSRLHKGTDFAAPTGTPVYAAGNGVVERSSRYGGYGHYVRIRHANGYQTAYAHLSRYGRGIKSGVRVRQGQVIGYVGSTGASTGPHLHYEVIVNGRHVNSRSLKLPTGRKLEGDMLDEFVAARDIIDARRGELTVESEELLTVAYSGQRAN